MTTYISGTKSSVMTKQAFQAFKRDLVKQGVPVKKTADGNGYEAIAKNGQHVLKAMKGNNGYLVTIATALFE